jgi:carbamoyl-phosphate synthase large subunit
LPAPKHGLACSFDEAKSIADDIGYPVLVRLSHVLGGRGMEIVYDESTLSAYIERATEVSPAPPVLVDHFSTTRWRSTSTLSTTAPISTSAG